MGKGLARLLAQYAAGGGGRIGLLIEDDRGREVARVNPDQPFGSASLYKLFVLWQVQVEIRAGRLAEDTPLTLTADTDDEAEDGYALGAYGDTITVAEARRLMITGSNNTAAWLLARQVGWATIEGTLRANGFPVSETATRTVTTAREVTTFFERVVAGDFDPRLGPGDYTLMLALLEAQQLNDLLPAGLPAGTIVAHKTGSLDGLLHDAGVVLLPDGRTFYVTVLTEGEYGAGQALIREVARLLSRDPGQERPDRAGPLNRP